MTAPIANPASPLNKAAVDLTNTQVREALEVLKHNKLSHDALPALILSLAINRQTLQQRNDAGRK